MLDPSRALFATPDVERQLQELTGGPTRSPPTPTRARMQPEEVEQVEENFPRIRCPNSLEMIFSQFKILIL